MAVQLRQEVLQVAVFLREGEGEIRGLDLDLEHAGGYSSGDQVAKRPRLYPPAHLHIVAGDLVRKPIQAGLAEDGGNLSG